MGALSGATSTSEFISLADSIYSKRGRGSGFPPMRMFLLHSTIDAEEITSVSQIDSKFSVSLLKRIGTDLIEFEISRDWGGKTQETSSFMMQCAKGWLVLYPGEDVSLVRGALYRLQPLVTPVRFYSRDFINLTRRLSKCKERFEIKEALLREPEKSHRLQKRGRRRGPLTPSKGIAVDRLASLVESENAWIQRMRYSVYEGGSSHGWVDMSVDRDGEAEMYDGHLSVAIRCLLEDSFGLALSNLEYWKKRQPSKEPDKRATPARISFRKKLDQNDLKEIIESMESLENMHCTVAHNGNPYLLLNLLDSVDGSSFDLYASGQDVYFVPVQQVTPNSYMRTTEALFETLNEGMLVDEP